MTVTKSYNRQNGVYYAYETTYEWSEEKQKKVQRKHCIGQFDPDTGEVIPNKKVGRPSLPKDEIGRVKRNGLPQNKSTIKANDAKEIAAKLLRLEDKTRSLTEEIHELIQEVNSLADNNR